MNIIIIKLIKIKNRIHNINKIITTQEIKKLK